MKCEPLLSLTPTEEIIPHISWSCFRIKKRTDWKKQLTKKEKKIKQYVSEKTQQNPAFQIYCRLDVFSSYLFPKQNKHSAESNDKNICNMSQYVGASSYSRRNFESSGKFEN